MAQFNADILLKVIETDVNKAVKRIEGQFNKLKDKANLNLGLNLSELSKAQQSANKLGQSFKKLKGLGIGAGIGSAIAVVEKSVNSIGTQLSNIGGPRFLNDIINPLNNLGQEALDASQGITNLVDTIGSIASASPAATAAVGALAASAFVFSDQLSEAGNKANQFIKQIEQLTASGVIGQLNDEIRFTAKGLVELAKADGLKGLQKLLADAREESRKLLSTSEGYKDSVRDTITIEKSVNEELAQRRLIYSNLTREARAFQDTLRGNLRASKASRTDSGFSDFSKRASSQPAIDKAVNRRQRKVEQFAETLNRKFGKAPLMLPSSEMLNASQKGIKRLSSIYGDLNTDIDKGLQTGRSFTEELNRQAQRAQQLPPIFNTVQKSLDGIVESQRNAKFLQGKSIQGTDARARRVAGPQPAIATGLRKLADLEKNLIGEVSALRDKKATQSYKTRQRRIKYLAEQEKKQIRRNATLRESLLLGAGFPLLFGAGPAGVAGGVIGALGGADGGFGGQIIASAIGSIIDQAVAAVAKLGQALNPLTADIDAVVAASGETGTAFGQLVKDLEEVAGKEKALAAATAQLANVIGQDGVDSLRQFGDDVTTLSNDVSVALSQASGAVAALVNNLGFLTAISASLQQDNLVRAAQGSSDPEIQRLRAERRSIAIDNAQQFGDFSGNELAAKLAAQDKLIAARQLEIQIAEQLKITDEANAAITRQKAAETKLQLGVLAAENKVIQTSGSLLEENAYQAQRQLIFAQTRLEVKQAENDVDKIALILAEEKNKLDKLRSDRAKEQLQVNTRANNATEKSARDAERAAKEEQRVQQQLVQYQLESYDLAIKQIQLTKGEDAALKEQIKNSDALLATRIRVINLSDKDVRLKNAEIALETVKVDLEKQALKNKRQEIALQRELNKLKSEQELVSLRTGLEQELAGLSVGESAGEKQRREQAERYDNVLQGINDKIAAQKLLIEELPTANQGARNAAILQLDNLTKQKEAYQELLPAIFAAEQQQLAYNQALTAVTPGVNALVGGIRDVVAGTKTAEEVFADFLNTIADQLAQTAAQMIAQFIAIGIARKFAFGGNPAGSFLGPGGNGLGQLFGDYTGFAGAFANGGRIPSGQFGLVGENGPEFINGPARITPMGEGGSTVVNITVNSNGGGSSSASGNNAQDAARLGRLIERSTLAIITREKRAGGTLSR